ncbi:MAG: MFS transporter [Chloroflexi bacterium]|nr:MFS transporter [Chloroflexota bacterium]MDA1281754.1 MFS transporter [Chloroflexota bacterium]
MSDSDPKSTTQPRALKATGGQDRILALTFSSLGQSGFRHLWFGMLLLMAAVNIQMLARGYLTWELTKSPIAVVVVGAGFAPPILLLSLYGGAVADRVSRKKIIQLGQLGMLGIILFVGISISTGTITVYHLTAASVAQGTIWAFLMPARQAIIGQLVDEDHLTNAVALNASGMSLMTVAAPGIGGLIYGLAGPAATYYVMAGLTVIALGLTSWVPGMAPVALGKRRMWGDIKEGLVYTKKNRTVLVLLLVALSTALLAMPFRTLLPVQIEEVFKLEVEALGLMLSMIGVGALIGSLVIAGLSKNSRRGWVLLITSMLSGGAILLAGVTTSYVVALGIMVILGLGDSGRRALNSSLIMEQTDDEHRGRVMGVYMMNFGLIPLGAIPLGFISAFLSVRVAFVLAGGGLLAAAIGYTVLTDKVRRL